MFTIKTRDVVSRLESSPQQKNLKRAHAMFFKALTTAKGHEKRINVVYGKLQISFFVNKGIVAKYTPEREGLANEGWDLRLEEVKDICTEWSAQYFEKMLKSN